MYPTIQPRSKMNTEFFIDPNTYEEGIGTLIVSDATMLVRPRDVTGQYPASVKHDTGHAYGILCLGNDMGLHTTHIVSRLSPEATDKLLDRVFYAFVDACCHELWCDAYVHYIVDGETVHTEEYGFVDGEYTMIFKVYCNIDDGQAENLIATLTANETHCFVVASPARSELGYKIRGFAVDQSTGNSYEEPQNEYSIDDEDPLAGDVDPTGGHYEPSMHAFDAHRLSVMRQYGDYTG